jgi:CRP-like cAMP-binding protein
VRDEFMTRVWYAVQRSGLTIPFPIATEIAAERKDFERPVLEPRTVLAQHARFADSLHVPAQMQTLFYSKGEALLKQGDEQDGLALVLEGKAVFQVTAPDGSVTDAGLVNAGDFYGEHSILAGTASRAALVALTDMRVALFDLESSRKLVEASPRLARELGETIDRRRADVQASLRRAAGR